MSRRAVRVTSIEPAGPAAAAGLRTGDRVLAVDGEPLHDSLDFALLAAEEAVTLTCEREGATFDAPLVRAFGEGLGLTVEHRPRTCRLNCRFCFVHQQPRGLRRSLCLQDDDLSLSFRDGNFVTLSSIDDEDLERACALRLSPLYISVHATDPAVRADLLRPRGPAGRDVLPALTAIVAAGITVHAQVVLVPGANDGPALERTLGDLAALVAVTAADGADEDDDGDGGGVRSIAVVPVGLTRFQRDPSLRPWRPAEAPALLAQLEPWRKRYRRAYGVPVVTPSDEWYLLAGLDPPPAADYDGFPQLENGVGLVRTFLDDLAAANAAVRRGGARSRRRLPPGASRRVLVATARLARPVMERAAAALAAESGAELGVAALESAFWGPHVTVAGLLTGSDLVAGLRPVHEGWDALLVPDVVLNEDGRFLDDHPAEWLAEALGRPVEFVTPDVEGLRAGLAAALTR